ncbi:MAG: hypothetical protein WCJ56_06105 [bacterium]
MNILENRFLKITIDTGGSPDAPSYYIGSIDLNTPTGHRRLLEGEPDHEFVTSLDHSGASTCEVISAPDGGWQARLSGSGMGWEAQEILTLEPGLPVLQRRQTYRFTAAAEIAIRPGFRLFSAGIRYTYPLRAHEQPLSGLPAFRSSTDWALPFPFHVWNDGSIVGIYGLDKRTSPGTIEFMPVDQTGSVRLGVYYPDTAPQPIIMSDLMFATPLSPGLIRVEAGSEITLTELIGGHVLAVDEEPLLEAERLAADLLLSAPPPVVDFPVVAEGIADFYRHCELWEPDAFGPGRGWFANMWVHTIAGKAAKRGEGSGYFDLGWGEGYAVEMIIAAVRYWKRTGDTSLLPYVNEMTRSIELFKRASGDAQPYFDRSDSRRFGDFMMDHIPGNRIWTHSLGYVGNQLLRSYQEAPDYPDAATRQGWLKNAACMARFLAAQQKPNGDIQDIFDDNNTELNVKVHRITARAVVCGLWTRMGQISGDAAWIERATRLAYFMVPEIHRYEYFNQMIDGYASSAEFTDSESACYALEGLTTLAIATRKTEVLALARKAAAFAFAWTYFYDVPKAHNGIARGGQCCRMGDLPLLYPIAPAKMMTPLLGLHALTGDKFFLQMASEIAAFIGSWQMRAPGKPWDGGMIHALGQYCGKHWGPDIEGQVDSGMATGCSLAAMEAWMEHERKSKK